MRLKKSLGQHLLIDEAVCLQIANSIFALQPTHLLEIGPGTGAITKYFFANEAIKNFKAYEIDQEKIQHLKLHYPNAKEKIFHQDILTAPLPFLEKFCVVGNFPYNISSQILFHLLLWKNNITHIVAMFQKEVADRIVASPHNKSYGILSVLMQTFFDTSLLFNVEANSFNPPPKVRSAVVLFTKKQNELPIENYNLYTLIIKTAFQQRRKQLRNSLSPLFTKEQLVDAFFTQRPENLSVNDFFNLYELKLKTIKN